MMRFAFTILIACSAFLASPTCRAQGNNELLQDLDRAIQNRDSYTNLKEKRLRELRTEVDTASNYYTRFHAWGHLLDEYRSYDTDSALAICQRRMDIAINSGHQELLCHARLSYSEVLTSMGFFKEASDLLESIPLDEVPPYLRLYYFHLNRTLHGFMADYAIRPEDKRKYAAATDLYRDSLLKYNPEESVYFAIIKGDSYNVHGEPRKGAELLENYLRNNEVSDHEKAIAAYTLSESYRLLGDKQREKEQLIISSIGDMKSGVREYVSLRKLALLLYGEGDVKHAYDYLTLCMEDAKACNARLRMIEINDIFPVVNEVYLDTIDRQQSRLRWGLLLVCFLSLLLLATAYFIWREKKKVSDAKKIVTDMNGQLQALNDELNESNKLLTEANRSIAENSYLKTEYIARYMDQCSLYIEKLDKYRQSLTNIVRLGKFDDLKKYVRSLSDLDVELRAFYQSFDSTFLKLFPTFVEEFNQLLQPSERIQPKNEGSLNTELRIFALIRLGVNDSVKIAQFLRYSVSTIYNYRTRVRNKALGPREELEIELLKIGRFKN